MKVKIGNFPSRLTCNIHTNYMIKKYGHVTWPTEYTKFETYLEKLEDLVQGFYNVTVNWFLDRRKQVVKVKIDRWDTWSMDYTLAYIILPMLKQLKENKNGAPNVDLEDVPKELHPEKQDVLRYKENGETDDKFFERWNYILDEMIWAFEEHTHEDGEDQFYSGIHDIVFDKIQGTQHSEMKRGPNDTFKVDHDGLEAYHNRKANGFRLFGKYYEGLWQ